MKEQILLILSAFFILGSSHAAMAIRNDSGHHGYYTIQEDGKPVLTYNFGTVTPPKGVKGNFLNPRSDYVHPVFGPSGEILTAVFDNWHNHHRGIYWAWAEVAYKGRLHDLHALKGVFARPVKILKKEASADKALISAENVWRWEEREDIVRERIDITAYALKDGLRRIDFDLTLSALKGGVTIARRRGKNYASFNMRMSRRRQQECYSHIDPPGAFPRRAWGEVRGIPEDGKETIGMMILQNPSNLLYPGSWTYFKALPWLEPGFPANNTAYKLVVGKPLHLSYRVIIRNGEGLKVSPSALFDEYVKDLALEDPLVKMAGYTFGQSRKLLTATEAYIRKVGKPGYAAMERRLIAILSSGKSTKDFEKWAFGQLEMIGSEASVPVAIKALQERESWQTALDVLIATPGEKVGALLLESLKTLPDERKATVIHAIGLRGDRAAVPTLEKFAAGDNKNTAVSARYALRKIRKGRGYDSCGIEKIGNSLSDEAIDRALQKAGEFGRSERAVKIYTAVWTCKSAKNWQRAAALIGLSSISPDATDKVIASLSSPDKFIRNGAARAMRNFGTETLKGLRGGYSAQNDSAKIVILNAWEKRGVTEAEPEIFESLKSANPVVRLAALRALASVGRSADSAKAVLDIAVNSSGSTVIEARETLGRMLGSSVGTTLRETAFSADSKRANVAAKVLAERKDSGYLRDMLAIVKKGLSLPSRTALSALRRSGMAPEAFALRALLPEASDSLKESIAETLVGMVKRGIPGVELKALLAKGGTLTGTARQAMVRSLPLLGGAEALAFVTGKMDETAVRALVKWPDGGAVAPLASAIGSGKLSDTLTRSAVGGLLKPIKGIPPARQMKILKGILPKVKNQALKKDISSAIEALLKVNLAKGMKVTASERTRINPQIAVDGNLDTLRYWQSVTPGAWLSVDLKRVQDISGVKVVNFYKGKRYYQYYVEVSGDNKNWKRVADMTQNTKFATGKGFTHTFASTPARYVKVVMLKDSANPGLHIVEIEVYPGK